MEFGYYGVRVDEKKYNIGDVCNNSHQLYQDAEYDTSGELVFPLIDDGPYCGFYDAGELNGTCCVGINASCDDQTALNAVKAYYGEHAYIIAGDECERGEDNGEFIIRNAVVVRILK